MDQHIDYVATESSASTSNVHSIARPEQSDHDQLPNRMRGMEITDNKSDNHDDKVKTSYVMSKKVYSFTQAHFCFLKEKTSYV